MHIITIILISIGLAMDAFAVSLTIGTCDCCKLKRKYRGAFKTALYFGSFQGVMPIIGWYLGLSVQKYIQSWGHWFAFGILFFIGIKMIIDSDDHYVEKEFKRLCSNNNLFLLGIATSIDALAVGLTFTAFRVHKDSDLISVIFENAEYWFKYGKDSDTIAFPALIIGAVTFIISFAGFLMGNSSKFFDKNKIEKFGGFILCGVGLKILVENF